MASATEATSTVRNPSIKLSAAGGCASNHASNPNTATLISRIVFFIHPLLHPADDILHLVDAMAGVRAADPMRLVGYAHENRGNLARFQGEVQLLALRDRRAQVGFTGEHHRRRLEVLREENRRVRDELIGIVPWHRFHPK